MNPASKQYTRLRYQERVDALKKAGKPVTQQTVYDESIDVGIPVPDFDNDKRGRKRESDYNVSTVAFFVKFIGSSILAFCRFLITPQGPTVFEDANRRYFQTGGVAKRMKVSLLLMAMGLAGAIWSGTAVYKGISSSSWPVVMGVIKSSELQENKRKEHGRSKTTYITKLQYEYSIGGKRYTSDRFCFGDYGSSDGNRAQIIRSRYPVGTSAQIHFNPIEPEESVLQTGSTWFMNLWLTLVIIMTFSGFIGVIRAINAHRIYRIAEPTNPPYSSPTDAGSKR